MTIQLNLRNKNGASARNLELGSSWIEMGWRLDYDVRNFGDLLLRESAGRILDPRKLNSSGFTSGMFGGSCLSQEWFDLVEWKFKESKVLFWGCGIRDSQNVLNKPENLEILGLRGFRSLETFPDLQVIGDPGLLAPFLFGVHSSRTKVRKPLLLFIPHFNDETNVDFNVEFNLETTKIPFPGSSVDLVKTISQADFVLTGSLHVGVVCYSLGIPFAFYEDGYVDSLIKYGDFASVFNVNANLVKNFSQGISTFLMGSAWHQLDKDVVERIIEPVEKYLVKNSLGSRSAQKKWFKKRNESLDSKVELLTSYALKIE
jgi:hypothetical protein